MCFNFDKDCILDYHHRSGELYCSESAVLIILSPTQDYFGPYWNGSDAGGLDCLISWWINLQQGWTAEKTLLMPVQESRGVSYMMGSFLYGKGSANGRTNRQWQIQCSPFIICEAGDKQILDIIPRAKHSELLFILGAANIMYSHSCNKLFHNYISLHDTLSLMGSLFSSNTTRFARTRETIFCLLNMALWIIQRYR